VADDLGDRFLLTVSNGHPSTITRVIVSRDPAKIVEEIRRTQKSGVEKDGPLSREPVSRIFSNNADVIEALDPERKKEARFLEGVFPAFEVLGRVKFPGVLMPPEELVMHKRLSSRRELIVAVVAAVLVSAAGGMALCWAKSRESVAERALSGLRRDQETLGREQRDLSVRTYQGRLKAYPEVSFFEMFSMFLKCLPPDGGVESMALVRGADMRWQFTGLVLFYRREIFPFVGEGFLKEARVEDILIQTKPGVKVSWTGPYHAKEEVLP
jgi:hypothetical protein